MLYIENFHWLAALIISSYCFFVQNLDTNSITVGSLTYPAKPFQYLSSGPCLKRLQISTNNIRNFRWVGRCYFLFLNIIVTRAKRRMPHDTRVSRSTAPLVISGTIGTHSDTQVDLGRTSSARVVIERNAIAMHWGKVWMFAWSRLIEDRPNYFVGERGMEMFGPLKHIYASLSTVVIFFWFHLWVANVSVYANNLFGLFLFNKHL